MRFSKENKPNPKLAVTLANIAIESNMTVDELIRYVNQPKNRLKMRSEYIACKGLQGTREGRAQQMVNHIEDPWTGEEDVCEYHRGTNPIEDPWTGEYRSTKYTDTSKDPWECDDGHDDFSPSKGGLDPIRMVQIVVPLFVGIWVLIFVATLLKEFGVI